MKIPDGHTDAEYLGDGVYASFDGWQIWLTTTRENGTHTIAIEPITLDRLLAYRDSLAAKPGQEAPTHERPLPAT